jgi:4-amino-4-deoxychorismate mutase
VNGGRAEGAVNGLTPFRQRLDLLDGEIAQLLGERFDICREVARYKSQHDIPMMQPDRVAEVRARYLARGADVDLPADFTADLFELLIGATCRMEDELMGMVEGGEVGAPARTGAPGEIAERERAGVAADEAGKP